ncbi:hypothetical protein Caci_2947 [Catenulispora acidiphila DSM 44928]|uniref:Uncharacterized protein n=1 Tax=Catenulispora acidiphila (strain DSM 44928 / JCM 14897 / NBRC 102108 / NRRL B-24433 / ID139908) TaxID=479433 RepID=C7Q2W4_CATAD|nr:hypothetical protein [Catenulispora acidiphila]ACU71856.1 hypothetical protein Caci_2947 [Catenulispora acidiphila DSM 44928]
MSDSQMTVADDASTFPPQGRLIHVAHGFQWNSIAELLQRAGVTLFEIPPGPSVPDQAGEDIPTFGLMLRSGE